MLPDRRGPLGRIFTAMKIFCALVWIWSIAFILLWPWEKTGEWQAEFPVIAVCENSEVCAIPFGELTEARRQGRFSSLDIPGESGETSTAGGWLRWKRANGLIETKISSWYFQTTIRYKLDGDQPILVEYQAVDGKAVLYGIGAATLSLIAIYLGKLRRRTA